MKRFKDYTEDRRHKKNESVKSVHPFESPPEWLSRAGVIQMSYDIVKAHGGQLKVETKEGKGSEFIGTLPLT